MDIMDTKGKEYLAKQVLSVYEAFFGTTNYPPYKIVVTASIFEERLKLCTNWMERQSIQNKKIEIEKLNGLMVEPTENGGMFYLLVAEKRFLDQISYIGTVAHEFTHILDFSQYFDVEKIAKLRSINNPNYDFIHFYSEVRARYRGMLLSWSLQRVTSIDKGEFYGLVKQYESILKEQWNLYFVAQFYGQYLAAKAIDRDFSIPIPAYLGESIRKLLDILSIHINDKSIYDSYDEIKKAFDDYKKIIG